MSPKTLDSIGKKLSPFVEEIGSDFVQKYVVDLRQATDENHEDIQKAFFELIDDICHGRMEDSLSACKNLSVLNVSVGIPYVMIVHELMHLQKVLMDRLMDSHASKELLLLHKWHLHFEDIVAKVYLQKYVQTLQQKNNRRVASLSDIYEKNIIQYYKSHLDWLSELSRVIFEKKTQNFPQLSHKLCAFGKWLLEDGKQVIQNNSKYKEIDALHKNLHLVASQIYNYLQKEEVEYHIILTYLEKCEMLSLSLGTELALVDNTLINSKASKDPLTGALNRQRMVQLYTNQLEIAHATSHCFVVAICDLDYFKNINDSFGHLVGDKMLQGFVEVVQKNLRSSDMIIRYGGEEFVLILSAIHSAQAVKVLEKIRKGFEDFSFEHENQEVSTTVSMGMVEVNPEYIQMYSNSFEDTLEIADKKLYQAKQNGRNQIV